MWRNGSSGRLNRKVAVVGSFAGSTFVYGVLVGALVTWLLTAMLHHSSISNLSAMTTGEIPYDPEYLGNVDTDDVLPSSLTVRGDTGHLCKECEESLSQIQKEKGNIEDELRSCLDDSLRRDEEDFSGEQERDPENEVNVFVGIQTGYTSQGYEKTDYDYQLRRKTIRETWFKSGDAKLKSLLEKHQIVVKFIVGHHPFSKDDEKKMDKEMEKHQDILKLDIKEEYNNLVEKSREFFRVVLERYNPNFIIKVDDDVYVKLNRLPSVAFQWSLDKIDYTGCMKTGAIQTDKQYKWYEEQHAVLGDNTYFTHTWGSMYVLSNRAVRSMLQIKKENLRYLANEDVTIGMWMLALDMKHFDDRRMCESSCGLGGVGLMDLPHPGLEPVVKRMLELHASDSCAKDEDDFDVEVPDYSPIIKFSE